LSRRSSWARSRATQDSTLAILSKSTAAAARAGISGLSTRSAAIPTDRMIVKKRAPDHLKRTFYPHGPAEAGSAASTVTTASSIATFASLRLTLRKS
jgi:hypothetical protein